MAKTQVPDQLELLRVDIEAAYPLPLLLVVSSARGNDGKAIVATELARSMQSAGYTTLLVRADFLSVGGGPSLGSLDELSADAIAKRIVRDASHGLTTLALPGEHVQRTAGREAVQRFAATCRASHAVTIVEAPTMLSSAFAMSAALVADGVVLAARSGRRVCAADRGLAKKLAHEGLSFLGVVTVDAALIDGAPPMLGVEGTRAKVAGAASGLRESPST